MDMSTLLLEFAGSYGVTQKSQLRSELIELRDEPSVVLDLTAVTDIDSSCIGELMRLRNLRANKGLDRIAIVRGASLKRLFEIINLSDAFRFADTLDEVLPKDGSAVTVRYIADASNPAPRVLANA
jgi:anti-anti-sigma regulatory factor